MKKILNLILICLMGISFFSCGTDDEPDGGKDKTEINDGNNDWDDDGDDNWSDDEDDWGDDTSDDNKVYRKSDLIAWWKAGDYVFNLGYNDKLIVYHIINSVDVEYDRKTEGKWSFNEKTNTLKVSYKETEYGTTVTDSWEVTDLAFNYIELDGSLRWTRCKQPELSNTALLVGTWIGTYDSDIDIEITFNTSGNFTMREKCDGDKLNTKGSWKVSRDKLTLTYNGDSSWLSNTLGDELKIGHITDSGEIVGISLYGSLQLLNLKRK